MQVVVKKLRINVSIEGQGLKKFKELLKNALPEGTIIEDDEACLDITETDRYKNLSQEMTPAAVLKIRRQNACLSQTQLSQKTGIALSNISLMENGRRGIGAKTAKKLAAALNCAPGDFIK